MIQNGARPLAGNEQARDTDDRRDHPYFTPNCAEQQAYHFLPVTIRRFYRRGCSGTALCRAGRLMFRLRVTYCTDFDGLRWSPPTGLQWPRAVLSELGARLADAWYASEGDGA